MKKLLLGLALSSPMLFAAEMPCGGQVRMVMGDHPSCNGNLAFKTTASASKWMCTKSQESGSVVLTALTTENSTYVSIDNANATTCPDLPEYREISYVIVYAQ